MLDEVDWELKPSPPGFSDRALGGIINVTRGRVEVRSDSVEGRPRDLFMVCVSTSVKVGGGRFLRMLSEYGGGGMAPEGRIRTVGPGRLTRERSIGGKDIASREYCLLFAGSINEADAATTGSF